ncbi:hypothetical protein SAMN02745885_01790 [Carboxydocella sporoproducens DSM 16521]|uniref:Uncharacterized protein n=2 Tax=Carboxydocella TaxID=178898 RepID=A0A1T4QSQ6_9FIRM|nr:hypothetical protein CFE_1641 [Carboxydocella thermautotrophica]AVX31235.1 hypothetical protein CTH_1659 [Carboxydocella thermautotrophica]SKA06724.1 hypothetical protein SAMN02745885_01790 [Carboxydocella sporoproducens DSM 16521]
MKKDVAGSVVAFSPEQAFARTGLCVIIFLVFCLLGGIFGEIVDHGAPGCW